MSDSIHIQSVFYNNPDQYPPIINSTRLLDRAGFAVDIFCRENGEEWNVSYPTHTRVRRMDTRNRRSWYEYFGFVKRVLQQTPKDVSLFIGHDMHGLLPARLLASRYRRPLVYHCHDFADRIALLPFGSRVVRKFQQYFARTADLVIVPDAERGALIQRELELVRPPLVVANAPLERPMASGEALRQSLGHRGMSFEQVVFRQGRIGEGHGIETTLQSMPFWSNKSWGFVLMGVGEPSYLERLGLLARELNVARQFAILPPVGYDQVAEFTPGADLGHALYEPIHVNNVHITTASNKIMEYLASGLPLLVSDTPAMRALIEKYNCGLVADQAISESIAKAINALLSDPIRAKQMGAAAARAFDEVFCYEKQFAPALDAIRTLSQI